MSTSYVDFVDLRLTRPPPPGSFSQDKSLSESSRKQMPPVIQQSELVTTSPTKARAKRSDIKIASTLPGNSNAEGNGDFRSDEMISVSEKAQRRSRAMLINFCSVDNVSFLRCIDLEKFGIDSGQAVSNATVQELCTILPDKIDELRLTNCADVTDVACWAIARHW